MADARSATEGAVRAAMLCAAAMVAQQVGGKATRDALFLTTFDVRRLAAMIALAAAASVVVAVLSGRLLARMGPARLIPVSFAASAAVQIAVWALVPRAPRLAAVAFYLHTATLGSVLVSGFWSVVSERLDPHAARRSIARIAGAGTLGGVAGGLAAERVAALAGVTDMIPLLACLHLACAGAAGSLSRPLDVARVNPPPGSGGGLRAIARDPYLRRIAALVVLGSLAATLVDLAFKTRAVAVVGSGPALMRLFAMLYTGSALLALAAQILLGRWSLERLGLAGTVGLLPAVLTAGTVAALAAPGLWALGALRVAETVVRTSLYRLGYELLYAPVPPARKRGAKTVIDVGLDRAGETLGAGVVRLAVAAAAPLSALLAAVVAAGLAGMWLARALHRGYIQALEQSLLSRTASLDLFEVMDSTTRRVVAAAGAAPARPTASMALPVPDAEALETGLFLLSWTRRMERPAAAAVPARPRPSDEDPLLRRLRELRSRDPVRARAALSASGLDPALVPSAIRLLAWDEVAPAAVDALAPVAGHAIGQLLDAVLDRGEEFAVRRRIARLLGSVSSPRVTAGLLFGLEDPRFEVRYECARALARGAPLAAAQAEAVFAVVVREAGVPRELWDSRRLLDEGSSGPASLEHVFTLLSLVLPARVLRIALHALRGREPAWRGTALEYLHVVLPSRVWTALSPILDADAALSSPRAAASARSREELERELLAAPPPEAAAAPRP